MPGHAAAGVLIYAKNLDGLAHFYQQVLSMRELNRSDELVVLESSALLLVIHAIPAPVSDQIQITQPPLRRENVALKFFVAVPSLVDAEQWVHKLGGQVFDERWQGPGFVVRNAMDCEGNVFQLREFLLKK